MPVSAAGIVAANISRRLSMARLFALIYGLISYALFLGTILYAIGFITGFGLPKTINTGEIAPLTAAIPNNLRLLSLFAIQHSVMARQSFKTMVDAVRPGFDRAQHLCAVCQPHARPVVLAMAADPGCDLAD